MRTAKEPWAGRSRHQPAGSVNADSIVAEPRTERDFERSKRPRRDTAYSARSLTPCAARPSFAIESLPLGRQSADLFGRGKARPQLLIGLELFHHLAQSKRIGPAQEAAAEGREADAQDEPHVHVAGV